MKRMHITRIMSFRRIFLLQKTIQVLQTFVIVIINSTEKELTKRYLVKVNFFFSKLLIFEKKKKKFGLKHTLCSQILIYQANTINNFSIYLSIQYEFTLYRTFKICCSPIKNNGIYS